MKPIAGLSRQIMYYIDKWRVKLETGMIVKWMFAMIRNGEKGIFKHGGSEEGTE